jgi:malate dehydrogenase (quinone)
LAKLTTRFLDQAGSPLDLLRSVRPDNLGTLIHSGLHNLPLLRYMLHQGTQSMAERIRTLRIYSPGADEADWKLVDAGIRVQVIKKAKGGGSDLHFDTEIVTNAAGTISALLGASPGASISAYLMFGVIRRCLPHLLESPCGRQRMEAMMPGFEIDLTREENAAFYLREAELAAGPLGLNSSARDASDKPAIATANQS